LAVCQLKIAQFLMCFHCAWCACSFQKMHCTPSVVSTGTPPWISATLYRSLKPWGLGAGQGCRLPQLRTSPKLDLRPPFFDSLAHLRPLEFLSNCNFQLNQNIAVDYFVPGNYTIQYPETI